MEQTTILKKMSAKSRLEQAINLTDLVRELALLNIKKTHPHLSHKELINKLQERLTK